MRTARAWSPQAAGVPRSVRPTRPARPARTAGDARAASSVLTALALLTLAACGSPDAAPGAGTADARAAAGEIALGPRDGFDLPAVDLDRIKVGDPAPDFSLESYAGPVVTLSDFRGKKNVVLVFYRGYW